MGSFFSLDRDTSPSTSTTNSQSSAAAAASTSGWKAARRNHASVEELIRIIPGRLVGNGGVNDVASLYTKQGKKGINQDAIILWENFGYRANTIFCGVFDGHGPYGHMIAKKVRDALPLRLNAIWALNDGSNDKLSDISSSATESTTSKEIEFTPFDEYEDENSDNFQALRESFLKAFKVMDKELKVHPSMDCLYSGTTAVTLVKQGQNLIIANVGDSRAVLGTKNEDNSFIAVPLTVDLKPDLPKEAERIRLCKGRVFAVWNEPEVARVWMPNSNSPGLAMSRALGDFCLKDFGLIAVPDLSYHRLTDKDQFVVLATDGIWDVLSNQNVVDIVASASQSSASKVLVDSAIREWKVKYPTSKIDDCAVICLYLNSNSSDSYSSKQLNQETELIQVQI